MGDYNRNDRDNDRGGRRFGGRNSGGRSFGGGRDFGNRDMHRATCAACGKDCEVPFMPSGDRPVYCSNCFESRRNEDGNSRGPAGRNFTRPNFEERRPYSSGGDRGNTRGNDNSEFTEQIKNLNFKLDRILRILEPKIIQPPFFKKEESEKSVKPSVPKIEATDIVFEPKAVKSPVTKKKVKEENMKIEETVSN